MDAPAARVTAVTLLSKSAGMNRGRLASAAALALCAGRLRGRTEGRPYAVAASFHACSSGSGHFRGKAGMLLKFKGLRCEGYVTHQDLKRPLPALA